VAISAKRGWLDTVIRIRAPEFSPMTLAIEADDDIADDLLRPAGIVLAPRKCKWCPCLWVAIGLAVLLGAIIVVIALRR
jgi:hypothetical protein